MARVRGPLVTPEVEALIADVWKNHKKWKAPVVRNEVSAILRRKRPELPRTWPSLSAVQKVLATVRNNIGEPDPQDKLWHMGTLDDYPIPPEAIPAVLGVWKFRREQAKAVAGQWSSDMQEQLFTIREAKWAARLSAFFKGDLQKLSDMASRYARLELIYQLIGRPFDSTIADNLLLMDLPVVGRARDEFEMLLPIMAGREDSVDQIRGLKEGKSTLGRMKITISKKKKEAQNERTHNQEG